MKFDPSLIQQIEGTKNQGYIYFTQHTTGYCSSLFIDAYIACLSPHKDTTTKLALHLYTAMSNDTNARCPADPPPTQMMLTILGRPDIPPQDKAPKHVDE
eukprot:764733-Hanusia_phi.AAC.1